MAVKRTSQEHLAVLSPQEAYDISAGAYDSWKWQNFWRTYEYPIVHDIVRRAFLQNRSGLNILDLGCGTGWYLEKIESFSKTLRGIDISRGMLSIAERRFKENAIAGILTHEDAESANYYPGSYDLILATRVLSHIRNPKALISRLRRSLSGAGWLIISDVDPTHNYIATKLPIDAKHSVYAETYKHDRSSLFDDIEKLGFINHSTHLITMDGSSVPIRKYRDHFKFDDMAGWVAAWRKSFDERDLIDNHEKFGFRPL